MVIGVGKCDSLTRTRLLCQQERELEKLREGKRSAPPAQWGHQVLKGLHWENSGYRRGCRGFAGRSALCFSVHSDAGIRVKARSIACLAFQWHASGQKGKG